MLDSEEASGDRLGIAERAACLRLPGSAVQVD